METARSLEERLRDVAGEGTSGMLIAIYHDVLTGAWRLQRLYD